MDRHIAAKKAYNAYCQFGQKDKKQWADLPVSEQQKWLAVINAVALYIIEGMAVLEEHNEQPDKEN